VSDPSGENLSATWTLFCVGCNERFPCDTDVLVCPSCGMERTSTSASNETVVVSQDTPWPKRELAHVSSPNDSLIGRKLHVYQCVSLIGSGGMGRVYLAVHEDLGRRCALKILSPKRVACDDDYVVRFQQEGRAAAALVHPNVVTVHAVGHIDGCHFLEMEFISGRSMQQLIQDEGSLTVPRALALTAQTASGLAAAHRADIVHRDIKPDNIMLNRQGIPKLSDFGLAKRVLNSDGEPVADGICGTPNFMAPELFQGESATPASDVYGLGICLYLMLTGVLPFQAMSLADLRYRHQNDSIPNVRERRPEISLEVAGCVARMTDPIPARRPQDAIEASQLLYAVLGQERDLESLLTEAFAHEPGVTWKRNGDSYSLTRLLPEDRQQTVYLEPSPHGVDDRLLLFYSICCKARPDYYEHALRMNSEMLHGSMALREINNEPYFVVVDTYPRATVDPEEIRRTVLEMAAHADDVEYRLTGKDQH